MAGIPSRREALLVLGTQFQGPSRGLSLYWRARLTTREDVAEERLDGHLCVGLPALSSRPGPHRTALRPLQAGIERRSGDGHRAGRDERRHRTSALHGIANGNAGLSIRQHERRLGPALV